METLPFKINIEFQDIKQLTLKDIGIRKKLNIFTAKSDSTTYVILHITQKSRILRKDAEKLEGIYRQILNYLDLKTSSKIVSIEAPLCSKAKALLEDFNWIVK